MRTLFRSLRLIPLAFLCAWFALAAIQVQRDRSDAASRAALPKRIGETQVEQSYLQEVFNEMSNLAIEVISAYMPGIAPETIAIDRGNPNSLDSLKFRTRYGSHGLDQQSLRSFDF